jgi:hypothetical protein
MIMPFALRLQPFKTNAPVARSIHGRGRRPRRPASALSGADGSFGRRLNPPLRPHGNSQFSPARVLAAAIVGGTTSVIVGDKFGNGALTGAFSRAFNDELHGGANVTAPKAEEEERSYLGPFIMDSIIGFGEGVHKGITFGQGNMDDIRWLFGMDPHIPNDPIIKCGASQIGNIQGGFAFGGALKLLGKGKAGWEFSHWVPDRSVSLPQRLELNDESSNANWASCADSASADWRSWCCNHRSRAMRRALINEK